MPRLLLKSVYLIISYLALIPYLEAYESHHLIPRAVLFEDFGYSLSENHFFQLSPTGSLIAYVSPVIEGKRYLKIKDLIQQHKEDYIVFTVPSETSIHSLQWQFDNEHILFTASSEGKFSRTLYQLSIKTGHLKKLISEEDVYVEILAYRSFSPTTILVQLLREGSSNLYRLNLVTSEMVLEEADSNELGKVCVWGIDNNLIVRVALITLENQMQIHTRENKASPWKLIFSKNIEGRSDYFPSPFRMFSRDNQSIYLISNINNDTNRLLKLNLKSGDYEVIAEDPEYDISALKDPIISDPHNECIHLVPINKETFQYICVDKNFLPLVEKLNNKYGNSAHIIHHNENRHLWVIKVSRDITPASYFLYNYETGNSLPLLQPDNLSKYTMASTKPIHFFSRDRIKIYGYMTCPKNTILKNLPAIILVHGGPWSRDMWGYNPQVQWLADRGYVVLQINYRGSTGYGKKYFLAGDGQWGKKMLTDLIDGKRWLIDQGYANSEKIAIMGHSFGGYSTLCAITMTPTEFCCGIAESNLCDLVQIAKNSTPWWMARMGAENLSERSPNYLAHQVKRPLMIAFGANDCFLQDNISMTEALHSHGIPFDCIMFENEGHTINQPFNKRKLAEAVEQFLAKHLGGVCELSIEEEFE